MSIRSLGRIEEIRCFVPPLISSILIYSEPKSGLEAKFSLQYCVSAFLVHGKLNLSHFEEESIADPNVKRLMAKVKVSFRRELEELMKAKDALAPTEIQLKFKKKILSKRRLEAKGGPSSPLRETEIHEKFRSCARRILPSERVERIIALVTSLESLQQVSALTEILYP